MGIHDDLLKAESEARKKMQGDNTRDNAHDLLMEAVRLIHRPKKRRTDVVTIYDKLDQYVANALPRGDGMAESNITKDAAAILNNTEYRSMREINQVVEKFGKDVLIIMPASDDLIEYYGMFSDETGHNYNWITKNGLVVNPSGDYTDEHYGTIGSVNVEVELVNHVWTVVVRQPVPHHTFTILEDAGGDEVYGVGMVIHRNHLI